MELKKLDYDLTVCKVGTAADLDLNGEFFFIGKTEDEISLVCPTCDTPQHTTEDYTAGGPCGAYIETPCKFAACKALLTHLK